MCRAEGRRVKRHEHGAPGNGEHGCARANSFMVARALEARTAGRFARTSRSDLINLDHIERFVREPDGTAYIILADRTRLRVSRRRVAEVRELLD